MRCLRILVAAALALAAVSCTKKTSDEQTDQSAPEPAASDQRAKPTTAEKGEPKAKTEATEPTAPASDQNLLDEPRERRLHPDRASASSFLWNDWNRFQENYHPLYLLDDDPSTAWVEGAEGSGAGQWVRLHLTPVAQASKVRLRIRNGYHKSKSLFEKNARAKAIAVSSFPGGEIHQFPLPDSMEWAEVSFEQEPAELGAIELRIVDIYPGSKYADLCISDIEVYVTARTPENPGFEKAKLEKVRAWKKERVDTAKWFQTQEAKSVPVATSYRVEKTKELTGAPPSHEGHFDGHAKLLAIAEGELGDSKQLLQRARKSLDSGFAQWRNVRVTPKQTKSIPSVDGLYVPESYEVAMAEPARDDAFNLPFPGQLAFLKTSLLASFGQAEPASLQDALAAKLPVCKRRDASAQLYWQPKASGQGRETIDELLVVQCGQEAERDSYYGYASFQLLEFDEHGRLAVVIGQRSVTTFSWSDDDNPRIIGGQRLRQDYSDHLVHDTLSLSTR